MKEGISLIEALISLAILATIVVIVFGAVRYYRGNFLLADSYGKSTVELENAYEVGRITVRQGYYPEISNQASEVGVFVSQVGTTTDGCEIYEVSFSATLVSVENIVTLPSSLTTFYVVHCGE